MWRHRQDRLCSFSKLAGGGRMFDEFADAISDFWSAIPERLYYDVTK